MHMNGSALALLGGVLLLGLATEVLGQRTRLPRVTLLILLGVLIGPVGFDWIPEQARHWFPLVGDMALALIGFLLGGKLTHELLGQVGRRVAWYTLVHLLVTASVVTLGLWVLGVPAPAAILLGAIATATDPLATSDVIQETRSSGPFCHTLLGIVALDDAVGLALFTVALVAAHWLGHAVFDLSLLWRSAWEIGGAVLLGGALGWPAAWLSGRIRRAEPILVEAVGIVFLCAGLAQWLEVSYLLACVVLGAVIANLARHHRRPFHAIEDIEWPFMILFFVLSGVAVDPSALWMAGWAGIAYVGLRLVARLAGGVLAGYPSWIDAVEARLMGRALMPQAGVALAMAYVASQSWPEYQGLLLSVVIGSTVVFEILGPLLTRQALRAAGEQGRAAVSEPE